MKKILFFGLIIGVWFPLLGLDANSIQELQKRTLQHLHDKMESVQRLQEHTESLQRGFCEVRDKILNARRTEWQLEGLGLCYLAWLSRKGQQPVLRDGLRNDLAEVESCLFAPDVCKQINYTEKIEGLPALVQQLEDAKGRFGSWRIKLGNLIRANAQACTCDFDQIGTGSVINPSTNQPLQTLAKFTLWFNQEGKIRLIDEIYLIPQSQHLLE